MQALGGFAPSLTVVSGGAGVPARGDASPPPPGPILEDPGSCLLKASGSLAPLSRGESLDRFSQQHLEVTPLHPPVQMAAPRRTAGAVLLLLRISLVAAYPSGRVTESCGDMVPRHGHTPRPDPVHNVTVARTTFTPGDRIEGTARGGSLFTCRGSSCHCAPRGCCCGRPRPREVPSPV